MNKKALRNKIKAFIKDAFKAVPKKYQVKSIQSAFNWCNELLEQINTKYAPVLKKHKVEFLDAGASRAVFAINFNKQWFVFKICYELWGWETTNRKNDNYYEWQNYLRVKNTPEVYTMLIPMVDSFVDEIAFRVNVFPYADMEANPCQVTGDITPQNELNFIRSDCIGTITVDDHPGNVAVWNGYVWLIDFNSPEVVCMKDVKHAKKMLKTELKKSNSLKREFAKTVDLVS